MAPPGGWCVKAAVAQSGPRRCAASMRLVAQKQLLPLAPLMPCGNPTWSDDMPLREMRWAAEVETRGLVRR